LEADEIERQLRGEKHYVRLSILCCFREYYTEARFSYMTEGGGVYKHQTTEKNTCILNVTIFKHN
jgi:hypothetical protein